MKACEITYHNTNCQKDKRSVTSPGAVICSCHENLCEMGNNWKENNKPSPGNEQFNDWKENLYNLFKKKNCWQRFLSGSHFVSKDEWSFIPFTVPDKCRTSRTGNHSKPPQQVEWMNLFSILCMLVFILLPAEHLSECCGIQQSCHIKQKNRNIPLERNAKVERGSEDSPYGVEIRYRSLGNTFLSHLCCCKVVKCACRALHSVSLAESVSVGGSKSRRIFWSLWSNNILRT